MIFNLLGGKMLAVAMGAAALALLAALGLSVLSDARQAGALKGAIERTSAAAAASAAAVERLKAQASRQAQIIQDGHDRVEAAQAAATDARERLKRARQAAVAQDASTCRPGCRTRLE